MPRMTVLSLPPPGPQVDGLIVSASRIYDTSAEELKTQVDRQRQRRAPI